MIINHPKTKEVFLEQKKLLHSRLHWTVPPKRFKDKFSPYTKPIVIVGFLVFSSSSCSALVQEADALPSAHPSSVLIFHQINWSMCQQVLLPQKKWCEHAAGVEKEPPVLAAIHTGFGVILKILFKNENWKLSNIVCLLI